MHHWGSLHLRSVCVWWLWPLSPLLDLCRRGACVSTSSFSTSSCSSLHTPRYIPTYLGRQLSSPLRRRQFSPCLRPELTSSTVISAAVGEQGPRRGQRSQVDLHKQFNAPLSTKPFSGGRQGNWSIAIHPLCTRPSTTQKGPLSRFRPSSSPSPAAAAAHITRIPIGLAIVAGLSYLFRRAERAWSLWLLVSFLHQPRRLGTPPFALLPVPRVAAALKKRKQNRTGYIHTEHSL